MKGMENIVILWQKISQMARLACGMPDYSAYVRHHQQYHPDEPIMSYEVFFRNRQSARYEKNRSRCC